MPLRPRPGFRGTGKTMTRNPRRACEVLSGALRPTLQPSGTPVVTASAKERPAVLRRGRTQRRSPKFPGSSGPPRREHPGQVAWGGAHPCLLGADLRSGCPSHAPYLRWAVGVEPAGPALSCVGPSLVGAAGLRAVGFHHGAERAGGHGCPPRERPGRVGRTSPGQGGGSGDREDVAIPGLDSDDSFQDLVSVLTGTLNGLLSEPGFHAQTPRGRGEGTCCRASSIVGSAVPGPGRASRFPGSVWILADAEPIPRIPPVGTPAQGLSDGRFWRGGLGSGEHGPRGNHAPNPRSLLPDPNKANVQCCIVHDSSRLLPTVLSNQDRVPR